MCAHDNDTPLSLNLQKPKRSTHLEEPTAPGGRKLSRSASLDSISSLGGATSSVQFQKPDWKASPKLEEEPKKKPIPLPANRASVPPAWCIQLSLIHI